MNENIEWEKKFDERFLVDWKTPTRELNYTKVLKQDIPGIKDFIQQELNLQLDSLVKEFEGLKKGNKKHPLLKANSKTLEIVDVSEGYNQAITEAISIIKSKRV